MNGGKNDEIRPVPVDYFLDYISKATGWEKKEFLRSKDIGNLETELNIRAKKPIQTNSAKRGKSMNSLYRFVSDKERKRINASVDKLLR
jgi:hypothetical protein